MSIILGMAHNLQLLWKTTFSDMKFVSFSDSNVTIWLLLTSVYHHVTYLNLNVMTYFLFRNIYRPFVIIR